MDDTPKTPELNKDLENAANMLNEAAIESETPSAEPAVDAPAAEMPSEPTIEPAASIETPTQDEAPVESPVETPAQPTAAPDAPVKKSKKGLAIGLIAGTVVLCGGIGLGVAYAMNNTQENIVLSAVSDFLTKDEMSMSGSFDYKIAEDDSDVYTNSSSTLKNCIDDKSGLTNKCGTSVMAYKNPISHVRVDIKNDKNADNETKTSATFTVTYNDEDITITVDSVIVKDYTLYVSLSNLKDAVKKGFKAVASSSYESYAEVYEDLINEVVGEVDGAWWKISVPDLVDSVEAISSNDKTKVKDAYSCVVDVANKASKDGSKIADIYRENAFVAIDKYEGGKKPSAKGDLYKVTLDAEKFANFANKVGDHIEAYGIEDCIKKFNDINGVNAKFTRTEVKADDYTKAFEELSDGLVVSIENGFFSHTLSGIYFDKTNDYGTGVLDLKFEKLNGTVSAPSDAKDISELVKDVTEKYKEWQETSTCKVMKMNYPTYYTQYCDPKTNKPLPQYQSYLNGSTSSASSSRTLV